MTAWRVYKTPLRSANFALNAGRDSGPEGLARLFPGMPVATARNIIERGQGRLAFDGPNDVHVPPDLCEDDPTGEPDGVA